MEETSLLHETSIDNEIIKALKGFSIVESVIKTINTLIIKVDNEQWIRADKVQKDIFTKTVHGFVNANMMVDAIYINNKQGKKLASLQEVKIRNNYMAVADTVKEEIETGKNKEASHNLEKALSIEDSRSQNIAAISEASAGKSNSDISHTKDILDKTLKAFDPESAPQPVLNQYPKHRARYKILIVFLIVLAAGAAGYYFLLKEPVNAKRSFVLPKKVAPLRLPQAHADKNIRVSMPSVQILKVADTRQTEPVKKGAPQPGIEPAALPASQAAAPPAHNTSSPALKEIKPSEPTPAVAPVRENHAQSAAEEKKVIAPPQQEAAANSTVYCVNVASCKLKESADVIIRKLQKKGYAPAADTITVNDTIWYRVTLGHFQTSGEARNFARELQSKENIKGLVVIKKQ
jgi:cell division septation protein DedD